MSKKEQKGKKQPREAAPSPAQKEEAPKRPQEPSRLRVRYGKEVVPALMNHFKYTNIMAVPKLQKIVINMGLGEAIQNAKIIDTAADELGRISGQRPVVSG